jgi:hypothetical protein
MEKKKLLEEISDWNKKMEGLYNRKDELHREINIIDIEIHHMSARYNNVCKRLLS